MKKILVQASLLLILLFTSFCSQDDPLIDNTIRNDTYLLQRTTNTLEVLSYSNSSFTNITFDINIGTINLIKKFRDKYFLINQNAQKIFIIETADISKFLSKSISKVNVFTIDFSDKNLTPSSICFPNATDAYIAFSNTDYISILDITNNTMSGVKIQIEGVPAQINSYGNQIFVAIPSKNSVNIIDTRLNIVVDSVSVSNRPTFVEFVANGTQCAVVAKGDDSSQQPKLFVIDVITREIIVERNLIENDQNINLIPTSITASQNSLFVACHNTAKNEYGALRIPLSNYRSSVTLLRNDCNFVGNSNAYHTIYFVESAPTSPNITFFSSSNFSRLKVINIDNPPNAISD